MIRGVNIIRGKAGTASINIGEGSGVTLSPSVGFFCWGGAVPYENFYSVNNYCSML